MSRLPVDLIPTSLDKRGYANRKAALAAARVEVQRLFGSSYDPKENVDYLAEQKPSEHGAARIHIRLIGDAYHAFHDQPVTMILVQKSGENIGYVMEKDSFIKENYKNDVENKGTLRYITIIARPSQQGALNSVCKPGFYWIQDHELFNKELVDTTT